ncbi:phage tail tape measure protein [Mycetocola tolaasinivorans]|uniref:Phage tail tape measure protein n=1 Tax=Mycetocola tolaasinivorans TaxID=76635 RepID=A0A3L7A8B0_9MICO|nr:phage tail tape measure protein [Mycetocola tolaasinivorans]RLP76335.1 phage tail tape measure protein [Mycetocola tolaasinivorans]
MADNNRTVRVTLAATVNNYLAGMEQARRVTEKTATEAEKAAAKYEAQSKALDMGGKAAMLAGGAMLAGTALSVKAAIDWESAWTGVLKTVDGTPKQLKGVEDGLRSLAGELPAAHDEIASVAEAAGQLGVRTQDVVGFSKVMLDLGESTNMVATEAATELARFMNVMGTAPDKVSNLGAAVVGLGNNYATTESEIVSMAQRLSGAGRQIGLTEGEVLGLATSLSSVGIEAEAGGSAVSKVMINIASAVDSGGKKLDQFSSVAGQSAQDFAAKWKTAPGEALADFVKGLANAEDQGKTTLGMLSDLGITEVRMRDALLRSAAAAENFSGAMAMGNSEFEANTALLDEASKRYATVESRIKIMGNRVNDAAISFGQGLTPAIAGATDFVGSFADGLGALPGPLQATIAIAGALAGGVALIGGATMVALPKVAAFNAQLGAMGVKGQVSARGLAIAGGAIGGAFTLAATAITIFGAAQADARARADSFGKTLDSVTGQLTEQTRQLAIENLNAKDSFLWLESDSAFDAAKKLGLSLETVTQAAMGSKGAMSDLHNALNVGAVGSESYRAALEASGLSGSEFAIATATVRTKVDESSAAVSRAREQQDLATEATGAGSDAADSHAESLKKVQAEAEATAADIDKLAKAIKGFGATELDARAATRDLHDAYATLTETLKKNGKTLDITTAAGRANESAIDAVAKRTLDLASATLQQTGDQAKATATLEAGREKLIQMLGAFGITGDAAKAYADKLGLIPSNIQTTATVVGVSEAEARLQELSRTRIARIQAIYDKGSTPTFGHVPLADGAVVHQYKDGGVRENHVAQIAPAGAWRVWAEDETGGEAYIPLAESKRGRSLEIWKETGRLLGVRGPQFFASGGMIGPGMKSTSGGYSVVVQATKTAAAEREREIRKAETERATAERKARQAREKSEREAADRRRKAEKESADQRRRAERTANEAYARAPKRTRKQRASAANARDRAMRNAREAEARANGKARDTEARAASKARTTESAAVKKAGQERAKDAQAALKRERETVAAARKKEQEANQKFLADQAKGRDDWYRQGRRGTRATGLGLVDQLLDISERMGGDTKKRLVNAANSSEKQFIKLEKASSRAAQLLEKAKDKLDGLKESAANLARSVSEKFRGAFQIGDSLKSETVSETRRVKAGKEYYDETRQVTKTGASLSGIKSDLSTKAKDITRVAGKLKKLAGKGFKPEFLADIAGLGVEGEPVIDALLTATKSDVSKINRDYVAIGKGADAAGKTVADANFKALITQAEKQVKAADANAKSIEKQMKYETDRIIKAIDGALKVGSGSRAPIKAYANGGVRENHAAQIASAGEYRVWAEDETGGEGYIPLAQSKRGRSLQVWQDIGRRFGMTSFAAGGVSQPRYAQPMASSSAPVYVAPEVSLHGAKIALEIDGREIVGVIKKQIVAHDTQSASQVDLGYQRR